MLCQTCLEIFRNSHPLKQSNHHFSIDELRKSALRACDICRVLWYGVSDSPPDDPKATVGIYEIKGGMNAKPVSKHVIGHKAGQEKGNLDLSFVVDKEGVDSGGRAFSFCLRATSGE